MGLKNRGVMMDHSLRSYLKRQSTEELETILNYVINNYVHSPENAVRIIIEILQEREKNAKQETISDR